MLRRSLSHGFLVLLWALASGPAARAQDFTLEQVLSSPFPSELTAAPEGRRVAWVFDAEGVRNIWVAEGPSLAARRLTGYEEDDGQAISDLVWTPEGTALIYVRGGAPNRGGEYPNPWSLPSGTARELWIVDLAGGEPRKLDSGSDPAVSPRGDAVVYLKGGEIWRVGLEDGEPEALVKARGGLGSLRWSPDGSKLAFVSRRGDHSYVGVFDMEGERITWMDPGVDQDIAPAWSPDGTRLAFIRIPVGSRVWPFTPQRTAEEPWSIRVANATEGTGRRVWSAREGRGSAFQGVVAENPLLWAAGDRLVFPWEADGWLHLYSVPVGGGEATLLTPGEFEVEYVTLSPDRRHVVYNSNQGDIDRRHLWRVAAGGGRPASLTSGQGIEWAPAPLAEGDGIALLRSDARRPARPAVLEDDRLRDLAPETLPGDFPAQALVEPEQVIFPAADGLRIHGQLFLSERCRRGGDCPGVLFFHGGSRRQMLLGWHYRGYYHNAYALNQYLASRGYVVVSVNYRSGTGYGLEFREALNYGAAGASEFNDVMGAGLYLRNRPEVDPARVGLWGGSYGGYLTALGLARASDLFAAGVDFHGVHDWNVVIRNFAPDYEMLEHPEQARVAFEASPLADVDTWRSPVLLVHGDDDRNVPFSETVDLVERLREQGVEFELLVFPDEVHGFLTHARWLQAYSATADFFDRRLREARAVSGR